MGLRSQRGTRGLTLVGCISPNPLLNDQREIHGPRKSAACSRRDHGVRPGGRYGIGRRVRVTACLERNLASGSATARSKQTTKHNEAAEAGSPNFSQGYKAQRKQSN